jgi:hypothetical protein
MRSLNVSKVSSQYQLNASSSQGDFLELNGDSMMLNNNFETVIKHKLLLNQNSKNNISSPSIDYSPQNSKAKNGSKALMLKNTVLKNEQLILLQQE